MLKMIHRHAICVKLKLTFYDILAGSAEWNLSRATKPFFSSSRVSRRFSDETFLHFSLHFFGNFTHQYTGEIEFKLFFFWYFSQLFLDMC